MPLIKPHLEPYFRIRLTGCDIVASYASTESKAIKLRLCLKRDGLPVACELVAKNGQFTLTETMARIRAGKGGPSSETYRALVALASLAEDFFGDDVPAAKGAL